MVQTVEYYGKPVVFPEMPEHDAFLKRLAKGAWEADLFEFMAEHVDKETVVIDVGAWIGVTPYWAAHLAKKVIAVDPDPYCCRVLREMQAANSGQVEILEAAVSTGDTLLVGAAKKFGDSETSALYAGSDKTVDVAGLTLQQMIDLAEGAPIFLKIDIEGYEYSIMDQLKALDPKQIRAISLSVHPTHYARSLKSLRRVRAFKDTVSLVRTLSRFKLLNTQALRKPMFRMLINRAKRNDDLQFISMSPPCLARRATDREPAQYPVQAAREPSLDMAGVPAVEAL